MNTRLILLGTAGGPAPKLTRNAPAQAITVGDATYVVDCGNGVARQLVLAGVPLASLRGVFVTHHHSDTTRTTATCSCWPGRPTWSGASRRTGRHRWRR